MKDDRPHVIIPNALKSSLAEMHRARQAKYREKKRSGGKVPVEVWIKEEHRERLKEFLASLN